MAKSKHTEYPDTYLEPTDRNEINHKNSTEDASGNSNEDGTVVDKEYLDPLASYFMNLIKANQSGIDYNGQEDDDLEHQVGNLVRQSLAKGLNGDSVLVVNNPSELIGMNMPAGGFIWTTNTLVSGGYQRKYVLAYDRAGSIGAVDFDPVTGIINTVTVSGNLTEVVEISSVKNSMLERTTYMLNVPSDASNQCVKIISVPPNARVTMSLTWYTTGRIDIMIKDNLLYVEARTRGAQPRLYLMEKENEHTELYIRAPSGWGGQLSMLKLDAQWEWMDCSTTVLFPNISSSIVCTNSTTSTVYRPAMVNDWFLMDPSDPLTNRYLYIGEVGGGDVFYIKSDLRVEADTDRDSGILELTAEPSILTTSLKVTKARSVAEAGESPFLMLRFYMFGNKLYARRDSNVSADGRHAIFNIKVRSKKYGLDRLVMMISDDHQPTQDDIDALVWTTDPSMGGANDQYLVRPNATVEAGKYVAHEDMVLIKRPPTQPVEDPKEAAMFKGVTLPYGGGSQGYGAGIGAYMGDGYQAGVIGKLQAYISAYSPTDHDPNASGETGWRIATTASGETDPRVIAEFLGDGNLDMKGNEVINASGYVGAVNLAAGGEVTDIKGETSGLTYYPEMPDGGALTNGSYNIIVRWGLSTTMIPLSIYDWMFNDAKNLSGAADEDMLFRWVILDTSGDRYLWVYFRVPVSGEMTISVTNLQDHAGTGEFSVYRIGN